MIERRYRLEPLAAAMGAPFASLGRILGASGSTWQQYRDQGVSRLVADRWAVKAGFHPYEVWPEMVDHDLTDAHQECAATDCPNTFLPPEKGYQWYCSKRCRQREKMRRFRATEKGAELARIYQRRYDRYLAEKRRERQGRAA